MNSKKFRASAIRHGEVVIIPVDKLPDGLEKISCGREVVIGHSESGHHHVAVCDTADLALFRPAGADSQDLYLEVAARSRVEHRKTFDKHETKPLGVGLFKIYIKSGYDYFLKRSVRIVD